MPSAGYQLRPRKCAKVEQKPEGDVKKEQAEKLLETESDDGDYEDLGSEDTEDDEEEGDEENSDDAAFIASEDDSSEEEQQPPPCQKRQHLDVKQKICFVAHKIFLCIFFR